MSAASTYDLVIIGSGPGGYTCALRAAQHGLSVALIERDAIGGTCLNVGCIPTKVCLEAAQYLRAPAAASPFGVSLGKSSLDLPALRQQQAKVVNWLSSGVSGLMYQRGVTILQGEGALVPGGMVTVRAEDGTSITLRASNVVIASGARERPFRPLPLDGERVIGSTQALGLTALPKSLAIVGAGAVGTEFASMFHDFGVEVTLIEALKRILPLEDSECADAVAAELTARGIRIMADSPVSLVDMSGPLARLTCTTPDGETTVKTEMVLVAIGRVPNTEALGLKALGIRMVCGYIQVDEDYRTSTPGIYAIGDCVPTLALAHVAAAEGRYVADLIAGAKPRRLVPDAFPRATFTHPEISSVGLTQDAAEKLGLDVVISRAPMRANAKAAIHGELGGLVKIVAERHTGIIRGIHIVGHAASEMIAEAALAIGLEVSSRELAETVHAHPTVVESIMEAADAALHSI